MNPEKESAILNILLADDDIDDCFFFDKALKEIPMATNLTTVHNGEELMDYLLEHTDRLPEVVFLDISMPRKTGIECLTEIKEDQKLKNIPVIMFSTSYPRDLKYEEDIIKMFYENGAQLYIRKPNDFSKFKQVIYDALVKVTAIKSLNEPEGNL